jgi:hypothetical protein
MRQSVIHLHVIKLHCELTDHVDQEHDRRRIRTEIGRVTEKDEKMLESGTVCQKLRKQLRVIPLCDKPIMMSTHQAELRVPGERLHHFAGEVSELGLFLV